MLIASIKSVTTKLKRSFLVNRFESFHLDADYQLVLKYLQKPFSMKREDEVFCNILRIIALKKTNQPRWMEEYEYLIDENMLEVFNNHTQNYLTLFFDQALHEVYSQNINAIDFSIVPKRIRKCFPLNEEHFSIDHAPNL